MKKVLFAFLILLLICIIGCYVWISYNINLSKQSFKVEVERYLDEKYSQKMIVTDNISIGSEKSAQAYLVEAPEIVFYVRKGEKLSDTYLTKCLMHETEIILKEAFSNYESKIYVSELKWCNPTPDGKFETFYYLDSLYKVLKRVPSWKDVNEYQKILKAKVDIKANISSEEDILNAVQYVKDAGCHIENLEIKDGLGQTYNYSF